jgi:hypothetical protein
VELEMVTCGAMMALRLTDNDISSERVSQQAEHYGLTLWPRLFPFGKLSKAKPAAHTPPLKFL